MDHGLQLFKDLKKTSQLRKEKRHQQNPVAVNTLLRIAPFTKTTEPIWTLHPSSAFPMTRLMKSSSQQANPSSSLKREQTDSIPTLSIPWTGEGSGGVGGGGVLWHSTAPTETLVSFAWGPGSWIEPRNIPALPSSVWRVEARSGPIQRTLLMTQANPAAVSTRTTISAGVERKKTSPPHIKAMPWGRPRTSLASTLNFSWGAASSRISPERITVISAGRSIRPSAILNWTETSFAARFDQNVDEVLGGETRGMKRKKETKIDIVITHVCQSGNHSHFYPRGCFVDAQNTPMQWKLRSIDRDSPWFSNSLQQKKSDLM